jgi:Tol biopolymer transport system component/tRNA A-37 threonylcarbamoyl transferase component Bud32
VVERRGETLLHYRLIEKIGEGGMGEVYRARDLQLDRDVAIKILPTAVAGDPERMARFEREAKTLAALNHPGIATVYGLHAQDGTHLMAMEFVSGMDLSQRIAGGKLPMPAALKLADQIAEALEAAHDRGIVHRDLKPSNIMVTPGGKVKVLDFGLARSVGQEPSQDPSLLSKSPTLTSPATEEGTILGTAAYMSPEQARGESAEHQTDIWAFGVVLYELIVGKRPFGGKTVSDILAAVLKEEPNWSALPAETPIRVRRTLRRCLAKDRTRRFHHIADARLELLETEDEPDVETGHRMPVWMWGLVVVVGAIGLVAGSQLGGNDASVPELPHREYAVTLPDLSRSDWTRPVISPDGKRLVYRIKDQLMIRDLGTLEDQPVADGEDGNAPFWSPDGNWLAFARDSRLWKVPAVGGSPVMLCELPDPGRMMSGAWGNRDRIAISIWRDAIFELPAQGGVPEVLVEPDSTIGVDFQSILYLPDGETLLITPHPEQTWSVTGVNMGKILAFRDGEARVVLGDLESLHCHALAWSTSGHLVYSQPYGSRGIWAVPFSPDRLQPTGKPFLLTPNAEDPSTSRDGTLVYVADRPDAKYELVWLDRQGEVVGRVGKPALSLSDPVLSPDGTRVAYSARSDPDGHLKIYVQDLIGGAPVRLTFAERSWMRPEWSPDGRILIFDTGMNTWSTQADGAGEPRELFSGTRPMITPDGRSVIYHDYQEGEELRDVLVRQLDGSGDPVVLLDGPAEEEGRLSPEGDYLAYWSDESDEDEIYLTRYPSGEGKWQISVNGGRWMRWITGGNELIYLDTDGTMMAVGIQREPSLRVAEPVRLFGSERIKLVDPSLGFAVSRDGERFLMVRRIPQAGDEPVIVVVQNWLAEF